MAGGDLPKDSFSKVKTVQFCIPIYSNGIQNDGLFGYTDKATVCEDCVTVSARGTIGFSKKRNEAFVPIVRLIVIVPKATKILSKYLEIVLNAIDFEQQAAATPQLTVPQISDYRIPLPPKEIQEKIVAEIEILEKSLITANSHIDANKANINSLVNAASYSGNQKLGNISTLLKRGKSAKYGSSDIQIIKSGQARGYTNFDFSQKHYVDNTFVIDERKLVAGDILINSTGVGTAGRVTLFNLDGDFVVDSHITILRIDKSLANPVYVLYALAEGIGFKNIEAMANGQSGQIELSISIIQDIKIPLPSIKEQQKIVSEIEILEKEIAKSQETIDNTSALKAAILKKYL